MKLNGALQKSIKAQSYTFNYKVVEAVKTTIFRKLSKEQIHHTTKHRDMLLVTAESPSLKLPQRV